MALRAQTIAATLFCAFAFTASPVRGDPITVYSNFGPQFTFQNDFRSGWTINGFISPTIGQQAISQLFTPTKSYLFDRVQLALTLLPGPSAIDLFLQADSGGRPGGILEAIPLRGLTPGTAVVSAESLRHSTLVAQQPYWLSVVAGAPQVRAGWNWNSIGDVFDGRNFAVTQAGSPEGPWGLGPGGNRPQFRGAFQIEGQPQPAPIPEPASLLMVIGGGAAALRMNRLRKPKSRRTA